MGENQSVVSEGRYEERPVEAPVEIPVEIVESPAELVEKMEANPEEKAEVKSEESTENIVKEKNDPLPTKTRKILVVIRDMGEFSVEEVKNNLSKHVNNIESIYLGTYDEGRNKLVILADLLADEGFPENTSRNKWLEKGRKNSSSKIISPGKVLSEITDLLTLYYFPNSINEVPELEYVQLYSAGYDFLLLTDFYKEAINNSNCDIKFASANGVHGTQITEWVLLQALNFFHNTKKFIEFQNINYWGDKKLVEEVSDRWGSTIGIFGYGSIGRQVGRVFNSLGANIHVYSHSNPPRKEFPPEIAIPGMGDPKGEFPSKWFCGPNELNDFFSSNLDILVLSAPLTNETRGVINSDTLSLFNGTFIINISRGGLIVTNDLVDSLLSKDGKVIGAALDVTDPEPLPANHVLWKTPNVTITPHCSGNSADYISRVLRIFVHNIDALQNGKNMVNEIRRKESRYR